MLTCILLQVKSKAVGDGRLRPLLRKNAARRAIQSNRLLPPAGESISLRQGVSGCSLMTNAIEPLHVRHYVKT